MEAQSVRDTVEPPCGRSRVESPRLFHFAGRNGHNGAHGANLYTCLTILAGELLRIIVTCNFDDVFEAFSHQLQQRFRILLTTNKQAFPAKNAARWQQIETGMFDNGKIKALQLLIFRILKANAQEFGDSLQFAAPLGEAVLAVHVMGRHEQLEIDALELSDHWCIRPDHHSIPNFNPAGGKGFGFPFDFNNAQSARSRWVLHFFEETQVGNVDSVFEADLKKACSFLRLNLLSVDYN